MKARCRLVILTLILCFGVLCLSSCGSKHSDSDQIDQGTDGVPFSRENTELDVKKVDNFGKNSTDDLYVGLDYIYHDKELEKKYGSSFEVSDYGGTSDGYHIGLIFIHFYKGVSTYYATIDDDVWTITLSKTYFCEWKVDSLSGPEPVK